MILLFPDTDTFRLVLTGGFVPPEVLLSGAVVGFGADGRISVETGPKLTKKATTELTRLGVLGTKRHLGPVTDVSCWPQILPVTRDAAPPQLSSQAPVLFEMESAKDLPVLVGEMLRLGNDRQSVRWLAADADATDRRALLRVVGPPYYTLLRAIDAAAGGTTAPVRAYVEQAPRVWVQVGYSHPFADQIKLADGQVLLVRPPRAREYVPDGPFRDVYEVLNLKLPAAPVEWSEAPVREKLAVPLRLVAGNAADAAELWVVRGGAADQLDAFVRDADERVVQRLKFAVAAGAGGGTVIVLRVTASKLAPPVLPLADAVGFKPYFKLPNLYIPAGARLHPTLRRDAVRKLLADDTDRLVWLYPGAGGTFTPETIPEDSFRPLEDWVDYVIETNHAPLAEWVDATRFDFEHYVCADNQSPKPPKGPGDEKGKGKRRGGKGDAGDDAPLAPPTPAGQEPATGTAAGQSSAAAPVSQQKDAPPSEWLQRRQALEDSFLAVDGPLDAPARRALWPQLAVANAGYGDVPEAALCWVNAMWEADAPPREWVDGWVRAEFPRTEFPVPPAVFEAYLKQADPSPVEMRQFAALLLWFASQTPVPAWFRGRLPAVQALLEVHENKLPLRTAWLAAARVAALAGADTLGLARVRDRLLQRLLDDGGPKPERDLPTFLRYAGLKDSARVRVVRDKVLELHGHVRTWAEKSLKEPAQLGGSSDQGATLAYIDLFFAFGLAKLGESGPARGLLESAGHILNGYDSDKETGIAAGYLFEAFTYRVGQALTGKNHAGLLSPALTDELEQIRLKSQGIANSPHGLAHYGINRMRQQSRILEPQEKLEPYYNWLQYGDALKKALAELPKIKDPAAFARTVRDLYRSQSGSKAAGGHFVILSDALPLASRGGESFALELLTLVPDAMKGATLSGLPGADIPAKQGQLLERALFLAAHYDRRDILRQLADQFMEVVIAKPPENRYDLLNVVARQCLKSLRKLGLRDEVGGLLQKMQAVVLTGLSPTKCREKYVAKPDQWSKLLQSLLNLAGGWLTYGMTDQALPILDIARADLLGELGTKLEPSHYTPLAQAYVAALSQGSAEDGLERIIEMFRKMNPSRVKNTFTTSKFYSRFHLNLVEETVLAVVSDDFALGPAGRRWLDEDEYLLRRRVHRDMRARLQQSGL